MTSIPAKPSDLLWIRWRDAQQISVRATKEEFAKTELAVNINLGWIVDERADHILLCHGIGSTEENDVFVIPTNAIIERVPVIKKRKQPKD